MRFEIRYPDHKEEVSSDSDIVAFGRDPSCNIVIKSARCSRKHAAVRVVPDGFHLVDMGSANGVYVLGQKIDDAIVREGDVFSLGDVFVRILPKTAPVVPLAPRNDTTMLQAPDPIEPPSRPRPPSRPIARRRRGSAGVSSQIAPLILGLSSIAIGVTLMVGPLSLSRQLGVLAYILPFIGFASSFAGLGVLLGFGWAKNVHYAIFTIWTLTCLLMPFGVIGFAYHLTGEDRRETDSFFAVVIGISGALAVLSLIAACFLARIYVPVQPPL